MILALLSVAAGASAAPLERFFVMGSGRIALVNAHTNERVSVRYRREDLSYDEAALARIRHVFRSADGSEGDISLRLIEILSRVQQLSGGRELALISGYRSPSYNAGLRAKGVKAAGGSLHTEGLAADLAFPRPTLRPLWMRVRELECCGAGFYEKDGFLHVDVGKARFWEPATSRVEENLSAGNARMFARTEFDRYRAGETISIAIHAVTDPPIQLARDGTLIADDGEARMARIYSDHSNDEFCIEVLHSPTVVNVSSPAARANRARIVLSTCEPHVGRTPAVVDVNSVAIQ